MNHALRYMQLAATVDITPFSKLSNLRLISQGGFGDVYHARHRDWSEVAFKKLDVSFIRPDERYNIVNAIVIFYICSVLSSIVTE